MLFYLPNLTAHLIRTTTAPWDKDFLKTFNLPSEVKTNKELRSKWISDARTEHCCYSGIEGMNPQQRVTKIKNPPHRIHYIIADYDSPVSGNEIKPAEARCGNMPPQYFERTLSGNARFIWRLERTLDFPSYAFAVDFLKHVAKVMKLDKVLPGFDRSAFCDPCRYYTNSLQWLPLKDALCIKQDFCLGWMIEVSELFEWELESGDPAIPMLRIEEEIETRFPGRWKGIFLPGARGRRFWDETADNENSSIVRPTGMQCFTGPRSFVTWREIFGVRFVEQFQSSKLGAAVKDIYFDGTAYWRKVDDGRWKSFSRGDTLMHLASKKGLSLRGSVSEATNAIQFVQNQQFVDGILPLVMAPSGVLKIHDNSVLNISTKRAIVPVEGMQVWGKDGSFPWISDFLEGFFDPLEQLNYFLSWLHRLYKSAYELNLQQGQIVFFAGPVNKGKTLLSNRIIAGMLGGHCDAQNYLMDKTIFNDALFESALWTIDDSTPASDQAKHARFSAMLKRMAANQCFEYHAKFRKSETIIWKGRVIITCNADPESIRMLPDIEGSMLDKVMLFRVADTPKNFLGSDMSSVIQRELPYFCKFILDYKIPEECRGDARYGVKAYHEETLRTTAAQSSSTASFLEVLEEWKTTYFSNGHADHSFWEGTATQLLKSMSADQTMQHSIKNLTPGAVGKNLAKLQAQGYRLDYKQEHMRIWKIHKESNANPF